MLWEAYLISLYQKVSHAKRNGCACHGVSWRHWVLVGVMGFQSYNRRTWRAGPSKVVLGGLSQVHHNTPQHGDLMEQISKHKGNWWIYIITHKCNFLQDIRIFCQKNQVRPQISVLQGGLYTSCKDSLHLSKVKDIKSSYTSGPWTSSWNNWLRWWDFRTVIIITSYLTQYLLFIITTAAATIEWKQLQEDQIKKWPNSFLKT